MRTLTMKLSLRLTATMNGFPCVLSLTANDTAYVLRLRNSESSITPKCKPNTPQVFLRRPKIGEMAWSNQGSPLLIGPAAPESTANVNIPLSDGNLVSLLPQKGIRMSQIPDVDTQTIHQLQILRDNLIKVCSHVQK
ncbi:borealin-like [Sitophilus oryzae]|uniref:Borealin-like n=1 Tax=Sitophilus oryzae TaxID=7048 RepID=A0A6J2XU53_SITOR|nr:borealin-like [Sitophilus oryzae]